MMTSRRCSLAVVAGLVGSTAALALFAWSRSAHSTVACSHPDRNFDGYTLTTDDKERGHCGERPVYVKDSGGRRILYVGLLSLGAKIQWERSHFFYPSGEQLFRADLRTRQTKAILQERFSDFVVSPLESQIAFVSAEQAIYLATLPSGQIQQLHPPIRRRARVGTDGQKAPLVGLVRLIGWSKDERSVWFCAIRDHVVVSLARAFDGRVQSMGSIHGFAPSCAQLLEYGREVPAHHAGPPSFDPNRGLLFHYVAEPYRRSRTSWQLWLYDLMHQRSAYLGIVQALFPGNVSFEPGPMFHDNGACSYVTQDGLRYVGNAEWLLPPMP